MAKEDYIGRTRITYNAGITEITVESEGEELEYNDFMSLIEALISTTGYSQSEIESYITEWAADIRSKKEN